MNQSNLVQEILSIRNLLQENTIGIILGERVNLDTAASALSLYLSLKESGKNSQIVSLKEPTVEIANLVGVDKIKKNFSGNSNRVVVSLPYIKGEIGKVSYKEENDRINFYLTATDGKSITSYETQDINLIWDGSMPSVVVVFGVNNAAQLASFLGQNKNSIKVINIDNSGQQFGDISIVGNSYSSTSEIVAKILRELRLPLNIDIAQNLLDGILYGTKNFTKSSTSPYAFESAGILMQMGALRGENRNINKQAFDQQSRTMQQSGNRNNQNRNQQNQNRVNNNLYPQNNPNQTNRNRDRVEDVQKVTPQNMNEDLNIDSSEFNNSSQVLDDQEVPSDWLTPKVFKGSQNIDDLK